MKRLVPLLLLLLVLPLGSTAQLRPNVGHPLLRDLVGWWRAVPGMTGGTTWYDLMPAARHGTLTNMTGTTSGWSATDRPGGYAQVNFDGVDDYVSVGSTTDFQFTNTTFTVTGWVKASNCAATCSLVSKRQVGTGAWFLRIDTGGTFSATTTGSSGPAGSRPTVTSTWADGRWRHFAAVITTDTTTIAANAVNVYTNGVPDNGTLSQSDVYVPGTVPVTFGVQADNLATQLTGAMDDIRIYSRGLSDSEIAALYQQSVRGDPDLLPSPATTLLALTVPEEPPAADFVGAAGPWPGGVPPAMQSPGLVHRGHPLLRGMSDWWKTLASFDGGDRLFNLLRLNPLILGRDNVAARSPTWTLGSTRPGGVSHLSFNGLGQWMAADSAGPQSGITSGTQPWTLCVWVRPDSLSGTSGGGAQLFTNQTGAPPYDGMTLQMDVAATGILELHMVSTVTAEAAISSGSAVMVVGVWSHVCGGSTGTGTETGLFLAKNGQMLTPTVISSATVATITSREWALGHNYFGAGTYGSVTGALDDARVWLRALAPAEVAQVYQESTQGDAGLFLQSGSAMVSVAAAAGRPGSFFPFFR
jgi:hypothetical protein